MTFPEYNQWMDVNGRLCTESDWQTYQAIRELLPDDMAPAGSVVPSGCGPHNYPAMRLFLDLAKPIRMLEIGFNIGRSAMFWLMEEPEMELVSLEIRQAREVIDAKNRLEEWADKPGRFTLLFVDSRKMRTEGLKSLSWDAAFIDGDHSYEGVKWDIIRCLELGIKHILFDDWLPQYGDVMLAVKHTPELRVVFVAGNMAYCVVREEGLKVAE